MERRTGATRGVEDVRRYLGSHALDLRELPDDTSTAERAASALGTSVATIVKSLLFLADGEPTLVLVAGDRKLNARRLARELGVDKVRLATAKEVEEITGYPVGGVPPVAHARSLPVLLDRVLLNHAVIYAAAGSGHAVFGCSPPRLVELTGARLTDAAG